jgi:hypothetical protein
MVSLLIVEQYVIGFVLLPFWAFISIEKERDMRKYYYSVSGNRVGPVSLSELRSLSDLTSGTLVWYEGLPSWVRADALPELSDVFAGILPPPIPHAVRSPRSAKPGNRNQKPWIIAAVSVVGILIVAVAVFVRSFNGSQTFGLTEAERVELTELLREEPKKAAAPDRRPRLDFLFEEGAENRRCSDHVKNPAFANRLKSLVGKDRYEFITDCQVESGITIENVRVYLHGFIPHNSMYNYDIMYNIETNVMKVSINGYDDKRKLYSEDGLYDDIPEHWN